MERGGIISSSSVTADIRLEAPVRHYGRSCDLLDLVRQEWCRSEHLVQVERRLCIHRSTRVFVVSPIVSGCRTRTIAIRQDKQRRHQAANRLTRILDVIYKFGSIVRNYSFDLVDLGTAWEEAEATSQFSQSVALTLEPLPYTQGRLAYNGDTQELTSRQSSSRAP